MDERDFCSVTQLRLDNGSSWNIALLNRIYDREIIKEICKVIWQDNIAQDILLW